MIYLLNVKITNKRLNAVNSVYRRYESGHHQIEFDRVDVFKYFLASRAVLDKLVSKYVLYIKLSEEYRHRYYEIRNYILDNFPNDKLILYWDRNLYSEDWRNTWHIELNKIDDDLIWYDGNDDHIFIDNSLDIIENGIKLLKEDNDPLSIVYFTHWPEQIKLADHLDATLMDGNNFVRYRFSNFDAAHIMKKDRYKKYFLENDFGRAELFRSDCFYELMSPLHSNIYVPTKELVRHFDGYGHLGDHCPPNWDGKKLANMFPSLTIPGGFFAKNIHIKYGYDDRDNSMTNINPCANNLYSIDENGTDYRWTLEEIPLFWKDKIKLMDVNSSILPEDIKRCKNYWISSCETIELSAFGIYMKGTNNKRSSWFRNHII